jgi:hypothetical protein
MPADAARVLTTPAQQQEFRELLDALPVWEEQGEQAGAVLYLPLLTTAAP